MTFEHRVGAWYLARMLTGAAMPEIGPHRTIVRVAFQQGHLSPIDDLVGHCCIEPRHPTQGIR